MAHYYIEYNDDNPPASLIFLGINGDNEALAAEGLGCGVDDIRRFDGCGVDAHFVSTSQQHFTHVCDSADAAADGEGHETAGGGALHDIQDGAAAIRGGGDVEEDQFVGALIVVGDGGFHGIAGIAEFEKFGAFDDTALIHVEAGDDAAGQHGCFTGEDL